MGRKQKRPSYQLLRRKAYMMKKRRELEALGMPWTLKFDVELEPEEEARLLEVFNIVYLAEVFDEINAGQIKAIYRASDGTPYLIDSVEVVIPTNIAKVSEEGVCPFCGLRLCEHFMTTENSHRLYQTPDELAEGCFRIMTKTKTKQVFYVPFKQRVEVIRETR